MIQNHVRPSSSEIRSVVTLPVRWLAIDLEYIKKDDKFMAIEIGIWDIEKDEPVLNRFINPNCEFNLSRRLQERGVTKEQIISEGFSVEELERILKKILPGSIACFWNSKCDLRNFPTLKKYALGIRCCMTRHAERYGYYSVDYDNHGFCKLENVAGELVFSLNEGESFHQAIVDARAAAYIWQILDDKTLPGCVDLIPRSEVEELLKKVHLENQENLLSEEEEDPIPF